MPRPPAGIVTLRAILAALLAASLGSTGAEPRSQRNGSADALCPVFLNETHQGLGRTPRGVGLERRRPTHEQSPALGTIGSDTCGAERTPLSLFDFLVPDAGASAQIASQGQSDE